MHERNGQSIDIQAEVNRCQLENTNGGPHTKRGGGKASNTIHLCEGKTNKGGGDKTDDLYSSRLSTLDANKPVKKHAFPGENIINFNTLTPTKQKFKQKNNTRTLICVFETKFYDNPPGEVI